MYIDKNNNAIVSKNLHSKIKTLDITEREYIKMHKDTLISLINLRANNNVNVKDKIKISILNDTLFVEWDVREKNDIQDIFFKNYTETYADTSKGKLLEDTKFSLKISGDTVFCPVILLLNLIEDKKEK